MKPLFWRSTGLGLSLFFTLPIMADDPRPLLRDVMETLQVSNCVAKMSKVEKVFAGMTPEAHLKELSAQKTTELGQEIWDFKLKVHEKLREFHRADRLERDCANAYRGALRAVRFAEDLVQEHQLRHNPEKTPFPSSAFAEGNPHVKRNPAFGNFDLKKDLKSGDVLLTRGNAYTSAAIASLGEFDTQFSHMSLVYVDPQGKIWTVEAHIEVGSFVRPLEDHIKDNNFRTMIFRYDDPVLAAKAAEFAFQKVKAASDSKRGNIFYDFGFDNEDHQQLFCSEVVTWAFKEMSKGAVKLPMWQSRLLLRKESFVRDIGITASESFVPADIEVEPRFTIIAEWRDANRINDSHEKDAVLQAMFKWAEDYDYKMQQASSRTSLIYRNVAWPLRRVPGLKKYFKDKLPINMSRELIGYFGVLESVAEFLQKELSKKNQETVKARNLPLLRDEMYYFLDELRLKDVGSKSKPMHKMYRPRDIKAEAGGKGEGWADAPPAP